MKMYDVVAKEVNEVIRGMELPKEVDINEFKKLVDDVEDAMFDHQYDVDTSIIFKIEDYDLIDIAKEIKRYTGLTIDNMGGNFELYTSMIEVFEVKLRVIEKELSKVVDVIID